MPAPTPSGGEADVAGAVRRGRARTAVLRTVRAQLHRGRRRAVVARVVRLRRRGTAGASPVRGPGPAAASARGRASSRWARARRSARPRPRAWAAAARTSDEASLRPRSSSERYGIEIRAASATSLSVRCWARRSRRRTSPTMFRHSGSRAAGAAVGRAQGKDAGLVRRVAAHLPSLGAPRPAGEARGLRPGRNHWAWQGCPRLAHQPTRGQGRVFGPHRCVRSAQVVCVRRRAAAQPVAERMPAGANSAHRRLSRTAPTHSSSHRRSAGPGDPHTFQDARTGHRRMLMHGSAYSPRRDPSTPASPAHARRSRKTTPGSGGTWP